MKKLLSLLLAFILIISIFPMIGVNASTEKNKSPVYMLTHEAIEYTRNPTTTHETIKMHESAFITTQNDGSYYTDVVMDSNIIQLQGFEVSSFPTEIQNIFVSASFQVWDNNDPFDNNANVDFAFQTNDPLIAEAAATSLFSLLSTATGLDMNYVNSWGENWYNGNEYVQITFVRYEGHIDWSNFNALIDASIPRNIGGLAETINVTDARSLWYHVFFDPADQWFIGSIDVQFEGIVADLKSPYHVFSLEEALRVSQLKMSPYNPNKLEIFTFLPGIVNVTVNLNTTQASTYVAQFPGNPEIPWDKGYTNVYTYISSTSDVGDINLSFTYEFTPYWWVNQEYFNYVIDPRGYVSKSLNVQGKDISALSSTINFLNSEYTKLKSLELQVIPVNATSTSYSGAVQLSVNFFENTTTVQNLFVNIVNELIGLGLNIDSYGTLPDYEGTCTFQNGTSIPYYHFSASGDTMTQSEFISFLQATTLYQMAPGFANTSLINTGNYFSYSIYYTEQYDVLASWASLIEDPLADFIGTPVKEMSEGYDYRTVDMLSAFGLTDIPWNNKTHGEMFIFSSPTNDTLENINFVPTTNNGWGWYSWRGIDYQDNMNYVNYGVNFYTNDPKLTDTNGNILNDPFPGISVSWHAIFYPDNMDFKAPDIYINWQSSTSPEMQAFLDIYDGDGGFFNFTSDQWETRFHGSGIASVSAYAYYNEVPVQNDAFRREIPVSFVSSDEDSARYETIFNTTTLADGWWQLWVNATDNAGNTGMTMSLFYVDNYNDSYSPAVISWLGNAPANDSSVSGLVPLNFTVTDDVGVFAVILWIDSAGYVLTPNADGSYGFLWETLDDPENMWRTIMVEVYDMDGHRSQSVLHVMIDNIPTGDPPTGTLIAPANGIIVNNTITDTIKFIVDATDDWGISEVRLDISGKSALYLDYNTTSGYYELNLDISFYSPQDYNYEIHVIDIDENTHDVIIATGTFTVVGTESTGGDPPVILNYSPGNDEVITGTVTFTVEASDDKGIQQVTININDEGNKPMTLTSGDTMHGTYEYEWDSTQVMDGTYSVHIRVTDIDSNQITEVTYNIITNNGRTGNSPPDLGLPLPSYAFIIMVLLSFTTSIKLVRKRE